MKHADLIKQMTLEEKASLMSGANFWNTKPVTRLGIPGMMLTDGPHGLRKQGGKADHLGLNKSIPATCYPSAAGLANTWDEALIEEMGEHLGLEAASEGVSVLLGPGVNIKRSPLCGRNFEYFSEDPYLSGKMAAALIRGIQSNGISACVKHFCANNRENGRRIVDSRVSERALREVYLRGFEIVIRKADPWMLMTSYNPVNGEQASKNWEAINGILRSEWGYDGVVCTDWRVLSNLEEEIWAGSDIKMPFPVTDFYENAPAEFDPEAMLAEGKLSRPAVTTSARRILAMFAKLD